MLAYLFFNYFKAYEKNIREWVKVGSPTNPLGERHFTPWSFLKSNRKNLLQRNGDRKRIVVVNFYLYLTILFI